MISTYKHKNVNWIDLENPTPDEIRKVSENYNLDPDVANDLLTPSSRSLIEEYDNYIYLVFQFPITTNKKNYGRATEIQEVDFVIGKDFIITNRYGLIDSLTEYAKTFTVNAILEKNRDTEHAGIIFYQIVKNLYKELSNRLEHLNDLLKDAEEKIFNGKEKEMVFELSKLNRLLLNFKSIISLHDDVLIELLRTGEKIYGRQFHRYLRDILGEYTKIRSVNDNLKEYLEELKETNNSLLATKQNTIMQYLTTITFIFLPLGLITGIFNMNTKLPIVGHQYDFFIVLGLMAFSTVTVFLFLKLAKWL
jgi:magnesium transporter